jgi:hypothetical protein
VVSVDCSSKGLLLQAFDAQEVVILSLYRRDEDRSMGIAIAGMVKFLRASNYGDTNTIKADKDNFNDITITFESPGKCPPARLLQWLLFVFCASCYSRADFVFVEIVIILCLWK